MVLVEIDCSGGVLDFFDVQMTAEKDTWFVFHRLRRCLHLACCSAAYIPAQIDHTVLIDVTEVVLRIEMSGLLCTVSLAE